MMNGFDTSVFSQPKSELLKKVFLAFLGVVLMGFGIAFNACASLGSDPISVFSYGIHSFFNINLGTAFNITNYTLLFIVLIFILPSLADSLEHIAYSTSGKNKFGICRIRLKL